MRILACIPHSTPRSTPHSRIPQTCGKCGKCGSSHFTQHIFPSNQQTMSTPAPSHSEPPSSNVPPQGSAGNISPSGNVPVEEESASEEDVVWTRTISVAGAAADADEIRSVVGIRNTCILCLCRMKSIYATAGQQIPLKDHAYACDHVYEMCMTCYIGWQSATPDAPCPKCRGFPFKATGFST